MEIFGVNLTDRQNQTLFVVSSCSSLALKLLFDQVVKPVVPDHKFSFLKSQTAVSLGLAACTTLKIMELAKLIPSVPLPSKVIGGASLFAWLTSAAFACKQAFLPEEDPLEVLRRNCSVLKGVEGGHQNSFHYAIRSNKSDPISSPVVHVIYNPYPHDEIHLSLNGDESQSLKNIKYALIYSTGISSGQINQIKEAAFGSSSLVNFYGHQYKYLAELSVSITHNGRDGTKTTGIDQRKFYLPLKKG